MNTALAELFRHNRWANLCLLDLCAGLDDDVLSAGLPGTYGPIRETLLHIVAGEEGYLHRLRTGHPRPWVSPPDGLPSIEELRERARRSGDGLIEVAEHFQPGQVYPVEWDDGEVYDVPAEVVLVQAINHATEHRSQVLTILTQRGVAVPELSGWGYFDAALHR
jgi:uncharacterized damage-inducible protein DinB